MVRSLSRAKGIIFAADMETLDGNLQTTSLIFNHISGVKLGVLLITRYSINVIRKFKSRFDLPVIADLKLFDVPHIVYRQAQLCFEAGADGLTISGLCGYDPILTLVRHWPDRMVFIFNEFTHSEGIITPELSNKTAELARETGAFGILAPGTKPARVSKLRTIVGDHSIIIACGIGAQGPLYGSAIKAGADYEIVGRSIYFADDPTAEARLAHKRIDISHG